MKLEVRFEGKTIEERHIDLQFSIMYLNSDNIVVNKKTYVIDDKTLDVNKGLIQLVVHEF